MNETITVTKRDGTKEVFKKGKLQQSLKQAHAPDSVVNEIVEKISNSIDKVTSSDALYTKAFDLLKEHRKSYAARYSLRQSLADLGPTGYPFEEFVARIFNTKGFKTHVGTIVDGRCTEHEVDVVAENDDTLALVEAKFHNSRSVKSSLQIPLYVKARFDDLAENGFGEFAARNKTIERWLVTNTKFSDQAVEYGECADLKMIGWGYPEEENLESLIEEASLQPVTALTTLSGSHKRELTKQDIVLCKTLRDKKEKLEALGFDDDKIEEVMEEVNHLCHV